MSKTTNQEDTMNATISLDYPATNQSGHPVRHHGLDYLGVSRAYAADSAQEADYQTHRLVGFNPTPERLEMLALVEETLAGIRAMVSAPLTAGWDQSVQELTANFQEGVERSGTQMDAYVRVFLRTTIGKAAMAKVAPCDFQRMVQVWVLAWGLGSSFPTLAGYNCEGYVGCDERESTHASLCQEVNVARWAKERRV